MSKIEEIRKRLAECPIPETAQADWDGTNHYEVHDPSIAGTGFWWLGREIEVEFGL